MGEFEYIAWLRRSTLSHPRVVVGPGDDSAVLATTPNLPWLVTTDMLRSDRAQAAAHSARHGSGKRIVSPRRHEAVGRLRGVGHRQVRLAGL